MSRTSAQELERDVYKRQTHEKLDKDRFRRDMGGVEDAYQEIMHRIFGENK